MTESSEKPAGSLETRRRWIVMAVAVLVIAIAAGVVLVRSAKSTDQEKVDRALNRLDLAIQGVQLDKAIGRVASSNLSQSRALERTRVLKSKAADLREEAVKTEGAQQVVDGTDDAIEALDDVARVAGGIQKSKRVINSSTEENINRLKVNRKFLAELGNISIGKLLASSLSSYQGSIEESVNELEQEESLPSEDSDVPSPEESIEQIVELKKDLEDVDQVPSEQIAKLIKESKDQETELLLQPAGTNCGTTPAGSVVLITAGEGVCDQLIAMVKEVNGKGNGLYSAPNGWSCGYLPITPSGNEGSFADGFGCTDGSVQISVFGSEAVIEQIDAAAAQPSEPECPPGQVYSPAPHLQECVVVEGDESED